MLIVKDAKSEKTVMAQKKMLNLSVRFGISDLSRGGGGPGGVHPFTGRPFLSCLARHHKP